MSGHNLPITPAPTLTPLAFMQKWLLKLADNEFENIVEETLRELVLDLFGTFPTFNGLTVKNVKGATYPVPFTDSLGTIPANYRVLGMQAMARNGTDSATGGAGVTAPPVYFQLVKDSAGLVDALLDEELNTVATTKARWVKVSGSDSEKIASFPVLLLEDQDYVAGDIRQYTFPGGQTRLVQWKADSVGYSHPAPTGLDTDPIYRNFAPLSSGSGGGSTTFAGLTDNPLDNPLLAGLLNALAAKASPTFTGTPTAPTPAAGNNSTRLATTAFVQTALSAVAGGIRPWSARSYAQYEPASAGGGIFVAKSAHASTTSPLLDAGWADKWEVLSPPTALRLLDNPTAATGDILTSVTWNGLQEARWLLRNGQPRTINLPATFLENVTRELHVQTDTIAGNDLLWAWPAGYTLYVVQGRSLSPSPDKDGRTGYTVKREGTEFWVTVGPNYQLKV
ncbi:hypothetical protein Q5H93_12355 [Hymenobacter sp. ASUV-10]|uniref:Uncharacterized protein n=1 Tax=Hymenobacter aranciens TaxID=3063996 RepID=A0ABT9BB82_9BACT|nr:hypothetical protein [Hymenobacter sp. ASUV-10]MDO7875527.1 hypothetical protein [Hymenobacter sp. ASUV-10]